MPSQHSQIRALLGCWYINTCFILAWHFWKLKTWNWYLTFILLSSIISYASIHSAYYYPHLSIFPMLPSILLIITNTSPLFPNLASILLIITHTSPYFLCYHPYSLLLPTPLHISYATIHTAYCYPHLSIFPMLPSILLIITHTSPYFLCYHP